jgi:hypothetical protein
MYHITFGEKFKMGIFQRSVLNKYLLTLDNSTIEKAYKEFKSYLGDKERVENIRLLKEENLKIFIYITLKISSTNLQNKR